MASSKKSSKKPATKPSPTKSKPSAKAKPKPKPAPRQKPEVKAKPAVPQKPAPTPKRVAPTPIMHAAVNTRPRYEERPPTDEGLNKPQKPQVDEAWQNNMREMLAAQRQRLLELVQTTQSQMAEKSGDLPDIHDRATEGFEDELAVGLLAIEAAQLDDINDAIERIDNKRYGLCVDCGRAIPRKRLEVLPFAKRCLACEGHAERRPRFQGAETEEEEAE